MNGIRMIVTDLDGTYLRSDKTVSAYTQSVIRELRSKGIPFVIATARPVRAVTRWLPWLTYDAAVFHNGAVVCSRSEKLTVAGVEDPCAVIRSILQEASDCHISAERSEQLYANFDAASIWPGAEYIATRDFSELEGAAAEKIIVEVADPQEITRLEKHLPDELYLQLSENRIAMIMNKQATKMNGIRRIARDYGVEPEEIAAFGDDYGDIEMLRECGVGVAVANALEAVKTAANDVCESCDDDGVAKWLQNAFGKEREQER